MPSEPTEQAPSYAELAALVASLRVEVAELRQAVAARDVRIAELEKSLDEARRSNKRQAAPFSKGAPSDEPAKPGRGSGDRHGRHGHSGGAGDGRPGAARTAAGVLPELRRRRRPRA